jgi:DNA-directed RNA polymerase specialized sigma24 family protein
MTAQQIARAVGVTPSTIRVWETGRTTPRGRRGEVYAKLLAAFDAELREKAAAVRERPTGPRRRTAARPARKEARPSTSNAGSKHAGKRASSPPAGRWKPAGAGGPGLRTGQPPHAPRYPPPVAGAAAPAEQTAPARIAEPSADTPARAFDTLYAHAAPVLVRQTYLLTGRHALSRESVERAFHLAWERWPEVAVDQDPGGWVRAAAYEYATAPWHRFRRCYRRPDPLPGGCDGSGGPALHGALLALPPSYRRALLLHDGLGLGLPDTAAETEASTAAAANRVLHARAAVAERLPELSDPAALRERLGALARAVTPPLIAPPDAVRTGSERRVRFWLRTGVAFTAVIVGATGFTLVTAPTRYEQPLAPGSPIGDVLVSSGPQRLRAPDLRLRDRLRAEPVNGRPERLVPQVP